MSKQVKASRAYVGCFIVVGVAIATVLLVFSVALRMQHVDVMDQQDIWQSHNINTYALTFDNLSDQYTLQFDDGRVVSSQQTPDHINVRLDDFAELQVNALFDLAARCALLCDVTYHPIYGFPEQINGFVLSNNLDSGLFRSVRVHVIEFEAL